MHGKSAEGEREEPETDDMNQNSSGWGRKNFKMRKNKNKNTTQEQMHRWCISQSAAPKVPSVLVAPCPQQWVPQVWKGNQGYLPSCAGFTVRGVES